MKKLSSIEFAKKLEKDLFFVGSGIQAGQVVRNLIQNACDELQNVKDKNIFINSWNEENKHYVSICDSGRGIPHESQAKLFTPFYTTKKQGKGTGIGLWISRKIICAHGGDITVTSPFKEWSTEFRIWLPKAK